MPGDWPIHCGAKPREAAVPRILPNSVGQRHGEHDLGAAVLQLVHLGGEVLVAEP